LLHDLRNEPYFRAISPASLRASKPLRASIQRRNFQCAGVAGTAHSRRYPLAARLLFLQLISPGSHIPAR
jgi:hypothetical protein